MGDERQLGRTDVWRVSAACRGRDPGLWLGPETSQYDHEPKQQRLDREAEAKAVCATCPVRRDCLAEHVGEPIGIWGGATEDERRAMLGLARRSHGSPTSLTRRCEVCDGEFVPRRPNGADADADRAGDRYCSTPCALLARLRRQSEPRERRLRGERAS